MIETTNYNILINDNFENLNTQISNNYSKIFILVDENTKKYCLPSINQVLGYEFQLIEIKSGEENKNIDTCCYVWQKLSELGADRKSLLINLGGGVIGDMGGFIASTFKRGFDFINIPTTLLSQVDASVGGKLGIDFNNLKNQIGVFADPKAVYINTSFFNSLDKKQILSGYAEILKHGLIIDKNYWDFAKDLNIFDIEIYESIVSKSVEIKNKVVTEDPFEKGIRKALNFGHTIGHAIESLSFENNNSLLHGEAVAIGIICESYLSHIKLGMPFEELNEITTLIIKLFGKYEINENDYPKIMELMAHDKKNENSKINFSLLEKIGSVKINQYAVRDEIIKSLDYYKNI